MATAQLLLNQYALFTMPCVNHINEDCLLIDFEDNNDTSKQPVSEECTAAVFTCLKFIKQQNWPIIELVPAYQSLLVQFDLQLAQPQNFIAPLEAFLKQKQIKLEQNDHSTIHLPCYYHPEVAPDLLRLAKERKLSTDEFIRQHCNTHYRVYCLGFSPGFAYLGWVPPLLSAPRLAKPRTKVASGSVGIADRQTGIYPQAGPGGWNIIGRCPSTLINLQAQHADNVSLLKPGQFIRFQPITRDEFFDLGGQIEY